MDITLNSVNNWPATALPRLPHWVTREKPLRTQAETSTESPQVYSDEHLVETVLYKGSQSHFRMLIARYQVKVHSIALSVLGAGKQSDAEDVAQEVFVK